MEARMPKMSDASMILSGTLVSVRRYATVYGGGTRSHVSVWTKERYEVWVRQDSGAEAQITIQSKLFPARTGHQVTLLIDRGEVLGLINWTTRKRVNYLRTDVIGAFRRVDLVAVTLLAIAAAMLGGHDSLPELAILVMLYVQTVLFIRARRTDARMNELMEQHPRTGAGSGR
jgi:hypothetical protein